ALHQAVLGRRHAGPLHPGPRRGPGRGGRRPGRIRRRVPPPLGRAAPQAARPGGGGGAGRGRPPPRRPHHPAAQRGRPRPAARPDPPGGGLLPPGRVPLHGQRLHPHHARAVRLGGGPPRRPRAGPGRPAVPAALQPRGAAPLPGQPGGPAGRPGTRPPADGPGDRRRRRRRPRPHGGQPRPRGVRRRRRRVQPAAAAARRRGALGPQFRRRHPRLHRRRARRGAGPGPDPGRPGHAPLRHGDDAGGGGARRRRPPRPRPGAGARPRHVPPALRVLPGHLRKRAAMSETYTITTFDGARAAYRHKELRQALYDAGEVVMGDVLVNLHGDEHRARRRLENRLFRRDIFTHYENDLFPAIIDQTLEPWVEAGAAELVTLSHEMMMNLAALISGVARPRRTTEESLHLYRYLMKFIEGATLAHSTRDRAEVSAEVLAALEAWDGEFLTPSIALRRAALDRLAAGTIGEGELPKDVLTVLLRNQDNLHLPHEVLRREIAFFLLAGAHTSATAFTRSIDRIFAWLAAHPEDSARVRADRMFVQRCVHETIRLNPSSPVGMRWAEAEIPLGDGRTARPGDKVVIDLMAVNRDPAVFGADGGEFNPE